MMMDYVKVFLSYKVEYLLRNIKKFQALYLIYKKMEKMVRRVMNGGSLLSFHIRGKVAMRHKKYCKAICFKARCVAIIYSESEVQTMRTEKKELNIQIGKRLQTARENNGYTQEAFAEALDVGVEHYRKIELGIYGLQRENMLILYEKYKIDPTYLLTGEKNHTFDVEMFLANCSREERDKFIDRMLAYMRKLMINPQ